MSGKYGNDYPFPSVRSLIRRYGLSNTTVMRALDELVKQGLICRKQGSGTFVTDRVVSRKIGLIVPGIAVTDFFKHIVSEINRLSHEADYELRFGEVWSEIREQRLEQVRSLAEEFCDGNFAGVIYEPKAGKLGDEINPVVLEMFDRKKIPVVLLDCDVVPFPERSRSGVGVLLKNAERTRIMHNHIHDGYYTGVSAGWVWGYYPSVSHHNEISHNHIHDIGKGLLSDMGGIYTLGPSYGTRIANNRIHGVDARNYGGWGIYQDEGSTGILVENNVVYDTKFAPYDIHYAKDITVRNNIFAFGKKDQVARTCREPHISCELKNNIFYWTEGNLYSGNWKDAETPYAVHRQGNNKKANEKGAVVTFEADRNVYFNPLLAANQVRFGNGMSLAVWRRMGKDVHSVYADPLFMDAARRDFRLRPGSPAFRTGFVDFDQSDIGRRKIGADRK